MSLPLYKPRTSLPSKLETFFTCKVPSEMQNVFPSSEKNYKFFICKVAMERAISEGENDNN